MKNSKSLSDIDPSTYILYPGPSAYDISKPELLPFPIHKLKVLDGTWKQSKSMISAMKHYKRISFPPEKTNFWRYQSLGDSCLSTIEAIYYFLKNYDRYIDLEQDYNGKYDNLFFFCSFLSSYPKSLQNQTKYFIYRKASFKLCKVLNLHKIINFKRQPYLFTISLKNIIINKLKKL